MTKPHWSETTRATHGKRVPASGPIMTASRRILLAALADHGDVVDPQGRATPILHERMVEAGYSGAQSALTNLLFSAEIDGLVIRETRGKRTYAIRLAVPAGLEDEAPGDDELPCPECGMRHGGEAEIDLDGVMGDELVLTAPAPVPGVDVAALAAAVLDQALAARGELALAQGNARNALQRAMKAEEALRHATGDDEALAALRDALQRKDFVVANLQDALDEAVRRSAQADEAAAVFRTRCEELDVQVTNLKRALRASEAELHKAKNDGHNAYPLKEHLSAESRQELARLMTQIPSRRGA